MTEKIQTAGNQYMSKETKAEMIAIENDEFDKAQARVKEMQKQLDAASSAPAPAPDSSKPPIPIQQFLGGQ